jgi:hypothetical protein
MSITRKRCPCCGQIADAYTIASARRECNGEGS